MIENNHEQNTETPTQGEPSLEMDKGVPENIETNTPLVARKSSRVQRQPTKLQDFIVYK